MLPTTEPVNVTVMENPYAMPTGYTSYFNFGENINNTQTEAQGSFVGAKITDSTSAAAPSYETGYNGKAISFTGSGSVADIVTDSTDTYLGVNFWDTPFNGLIDDLHIYNGTTLSDNQIMALYEVTSK